MCFLGNPCEWGEVPPFTFTTHPHVVIPEHNSVPLSRPPRGEPRGDSLSTNTVKLSFRLELTGSLAGLFFSRLHVLFFLIIVALSWRLDLFH